MSVPPRVREMVRDLLGIELDHSTSERVRELLEGDGRGSSRADALVDSLRASGERAPEFNALVQAVTNGQTYFMRDAAQLSALDAFFRTYLPAQSRTLHVWSAGCSSGEEPYTLAMLAHAAGVRVEIVASDISLHALERARRGVYGEWSLRHVEPRQRLAHFRPVADGFELMEGVKRVVTFRAHNLAADPALRSQRSDGRWDLILCRHVLIYFAGQVRRRVVHSLTSALLEEGALLLSSVETVRGLGTDLHYRYLGGGFVLARGERRKSLRPTGAPAEMTELGHSQAHAASLAPVPIMARASSLPPAPRTRERSVSAYFIGLGNDWLRRHELDQALDAYAEATKLDGVAFEPYLLSAIVHLKRGNLAQAAASLRSALFLEPKAWAAEYLMASIRVREGRPGEARASLATATRLLAGDAVLSYQSDCDGIEPLCYTLDEARAACAQRGAALGDRTRT